MKKIILIIMLVLVAIPCFAADKNVNTVKQMFSQYDVKRDLSKLDLYYTKTFVLVSNRQRFDYTAYKEQQAAIFNKLKQIQVHYYDIFPAAENKVVARIRFHLSMKDGQQHVFYAIIVFKMKHHKINRVWELVYPSWRDKLPKAKG